MLVCLLLVIARRARGRAFLCRVADEGLFVASIEDALAAEMAEAIASNQPLLPLLEPRVATVLLRLVAVAEAHVDELPEGVADAARDARAIVGEWHVDTSHLAA